MRDLVTLEWIRERDTEGLLQDSDSSTVESAITAVSALVIQKVGHDFGSTTDEQEIDGAETSQLDLTGKTAYPLTSLTAAYIDDARVPVINIIGRPNRRIGLTTCLALKIGSWKGYTVKLTGTFGWTEVPDVVKEAVYRLVCNRINGNSEDKTIRAVRHPDGVQVEYAVADMSPRSRIGTGDDYADDVIANYWWKQGGGMV